jgi:hypothetical protein
MFTCNLFPDTEDREKLFLTMQLPFVPVAGYEHEGTVLRFRGKEWLVTSVEYDCDKEEFFLGVQEN